MAHHASLAATGSYFKFQHACADVYLVPMFSDNYGFVMVDRDTNSSACVDPAQPDVVIKCIEDVGVNNRLLLCTHKHNDHAGGNEAMKTWNPAISVIGTSYEFIPGLTHPASEGDIFTLGSLKIQTLYTPCHTKGHVCYYVTHNAPRDELTSRPILFCGDTLFVGGCGRFFEGTARDMLQNMDRLSQLPDETVVFCAHEYTMSNYRFLQSIDANRISAKLASLQSLRDVNLPTVPR